jgi:hypothetical protein
MRKIHFIGMVRFSQEERRWVSQWKRAARELEKQHAAELRCLTVEQARRITDTLLNMNGSLRLAEARKRRTSGLVEQQKYFMKWKGLSQD